tara:strand:+ start:173 stop:862 length:690 start_codon:yes stop_codon:yes gene_type:complete
MRPFKRFLLVLLLSPWVHANDTRDIEFTVYGQYPVRGVEYKPISDAELANGAKPQPPVEIRTHTLSRMGPYTFKGGNQLRFTDISSGELVATVSVTESSDRWLLIFVRNPLHLNDPENQLKYLVYPFDDSSKNLPRNQLVLLNISGKELDGFLEDDRVKVSMGESEAIKVQKSMPISLWTQDFRGERLLPALIKTYQFEANHRYLMIFFPPVLRGSADLDVRFLSEKVP